MQKTSFKSKKFQSTITTLTGNVDFFIFNAKVTNLCPLNIKDGFYISAADDRN